MAVSLFNDTDLRLLCKMSHSELKKVLATKTVKEALIFRRNLQISLTQYSKKFPAIGRLDEVQGNALLICKQIENAARNAFTVTGWRKIKASMPNMSLTEKIERKSFIKAQWEKLLRTYSY